MKKQNNQITSIIRRIKENVTPILSIIALLVSISVAIYTQIRLHSETRGFQREELRNLVIQILETKEKCDRELLILEEDSEEIDLVLSYLGRKISVYLDAAEQLTQQIFQQITTEEYLVLAEGSITVGKFSQAESFFEWAIYVSDSFLKEHHALMSLGLFHFGDYGTYNNPPKGRKIFREAVEAFNMPTNEDDIFIIGDAYEIWGDCELRNGFETLALEKFNLAKKYYSNLSTHYFRDKEKLLSRLNLKISQIRKNSQN